MRTYKSIDELTLMDDDFMTAVLKDNTPAVELIIRTVLGIPDLTVARHTVQDQHVNLRGHGIILDVLATDSKGRLYNIEVQNESGGAIPERARYHAALLDASSLDTGQPFNQLPELYVIFITRDDAMGAGLPIYHIDRTICETGKFFLDRAHIIYVNCGYEGDWSEVGLSGLGDLVRDMKEPEPDKMAFKELSSRAKGLKGDKDWREGMYKSVFKEALAEGWEKGLAEGRAKGLEQGMAEGLEQGLAEGLEQGLAEGLEQGLAEGRASLVAATKAVRECVKNNPLTSAEEAMDALGISDDLRQSVRELLA